MSESRLHAILSGRDRSASARALRLAATLAEPAYRAAVALRNTTFELKLRKARRLPAPVISIGNLTAGGTGKTPMVVEIASKLLALGARPAVLMRGYMPEAGAPSDEQAVLLAALGNGSRVPVACDPDRAVAAQRAVDQQPGTDVFILDDAFQHRQIHRDLDVVLIDATEPFGYGRVLPRGLLRESRRGLRRADAVIVTHADQCPDLRALDCKIEQITGRPPVAHAAHVWAGYVCDLDDRAAPTDALRDKPAAIVSGIGNPLAFERAARQHCSELCSVTALADHHHYTADELRQFYERATEAGAHVVLTTEKDWVKWRPLLEAQPSLMTLPTYRPALRIGFIDGGDAVDRLLADLMANRGR